MKKLLLTLISVLTLLLISGCSSDECDPACSDWQECKEGTCELSAGKCETNTDCTTAGQTCNTTTHTCETASVCSPACDSWEICENSVCKLASGKCETNTDCTTAGQTCNTTTHICEVAQLSPFHILATAHEFRSGDSYYIPMNDGVSSVALFSEQREAMGLLNDSDSSITINKMELIDEGDVVGEEYILQDTAMTPAELVVNNLEIAKDGRLDFHVRFYPVASGERKATLKITYNTDKVFELKLTGKGRDQANFFSKGNIVYEKILGGINSDEMASGMVANSNGDMFFYGHGAQIIDTFAYDLVIGKINSDGTLGWAKIWNGPYRDYSNDPGQNGESGGSANSITIDEEGFIYITGAISPSTSNNNFATLIAKLNPANGEIVWEKLWRPNWPTSILSKHNASGYSIAVKGDYVYVTGTTGADSGTEESNIFLLSLKKADGEVYFQKAFDPNPTYVDRGYSLKIDGNNNAYIGGIGNANGLLIKIASINTTTPVITWVKKVNIGTGGNLNSIDLDSTGNIYSTFDIRGASTAFAFGKMTSDGALSWGKIYPGSTNDQNNVNVIKIINNSVFAGGRIGLSLYDTQFGDGLIVKTDLNGVKDYSAFYYSGKGPDEMAEYRVKGFDIAGGNLLIFGQIYTASMNGVDYSGYWYDGIEDLEEYNVVISDVPNIVLNDLPNGVLKDASTSRTYVDLPTTVKYQDGVSKKDGVPPDGEFSFIKIQLK